MEANDLDGRLVRPAVTAPPVVHLSELPMNAFAELRGCSCLKEAWPDANQSLPLDFFVSK